MGSYDFDKIIDRRGTNSLKWDIRPGELPMWVADMDFQTAPEVAEAIRRRAEHGVFGYSDVPGEWYEAYIGWWKRRHHFSIEKEWLTFCTGVIPAISSIVRKLTTPAEKVILMTPVYNIFFNSVVNNGRVPVECPLRNAGPREDGMDRKGEEKDHFEVDWEKFTRLAKDPQTTMLIFCNPQNPIGRVWDRETLERVGEICENEGITVVSDEIHCDLICPTGHYLPFAAVNERNRRISITCIAPTKTFNLAGICSAAVMIPNPHIHARVRRALNTDEVAEPNAFAVQAAVAAYEQGEAWLEELLSYIGENKRMIREYIRDRIPSLRDVSDKGTYLSWIDARSLLGAEEERGISFAAFLRKETGLWISDGRSYGKAGKGYLRINAATPASNVMDGLERLERGTELFRLKNS